MFENLQLLLGSFFSIAVSVLLKKVIENYLPNPSIKKDHYYLSLLKNEYKHSYELFYSFGCPSKVIYKKVMNDKDPIKLVYLLEKYSKFYNFSDGGISIKGQIILERRFYLHMFRYLHSILTLPTTVIAIILTFCHLYDTFNLGFLWLVNMALFTFIVMSFIFYFSSFGASYIKYNFTESSEINDYKELVNQKEKPLSNSAILLIITCNVISLIVSVKLIEITYNYYSIACVVILPIIPTIIEIFLHKLNK